MLDSRPIRAAWRGFGDQVDRSSREVGVLNSMTRRRANPMALQLHCPCTCLPDCPPRAMGVLHRNMMVVVEYVAVRALRQEGLEKDSR